MGKGYTPYKMKANGHNNSPIEKNYGNAQERGFPFTGGVGSKEMQSGVADRLTASPNKSWLSNIAKKAGGMVKKVGGAMLDPLGLKKKMIAKAKGLAGGVAGTGGGDTAGLEARVAALEASGSGSGEAIPGAVPGAGGDPVFNGGSGGMAEEDVTKQTGAGWGGIGQQEGVV